MGGSKMIGLILAFLLGVGYAFLAPKSANYFNVPRWIGIFFDIGALLLFVWLVVRFY